MPLRCAWAVHPSHCLCAGETLPMWKPTTGEPYAGEPHVRFGGRGGATPLPDPYRNCVMLNAHIRQLRDEVLDLVATIWIESASLNNTD